MVVPCGFDWILSSLIIGKCQFKVYEFKYENIHGISLQSIDFISLSGIYVTLISCPVQRNVREEKVWSCSTRIAG
jgi:hypothetical protein